MIVVSNFILLIILISCWFSDSESYLTWTTESKLVFHSCGANPWWNQSAPYTYTYQCCSGTHQISHHTNIDHQSGLVLTQMFWNNLAFNLWLAGSNSISERWQLLFCTGAMWVPMFFCFSYFKGLCPPVLCALSDIYSFWRSRCAWVRISWKSSIGTVSFILKASGLTQHQRKENSLTSKLKILNRQRLMTM